MKRLISMPVLQASVILLIGPHADIKRHIPKGMAPRKQNYAGFCAFKHAKEAPVPFRVLIHLLRPEWPVMAHEAAHAASYICKAMGVGASFNNDELHAYVVQYICEQAEAVMGG